jgi:ATP-dependent Clp protease ATP-binding subunit ClpC
VARDSTVYSGAAIEYYRNMGSDLAPQQSYLAWHYGNGMAGVVTLWKNGIEFFYHYFSIPVLLATLFTPFRRVYKVKQGSGFSFQEWADRTSYNLLSCVMGAIIRSAVIVTGIVCIVLVGLVGLLGVCLWIIGIGLTLPFYYAFRPKRYVYKVGEFKQPSAVLVKILRTPWGIFFLHRTGIGLPGLTSACGTGQTLTISQNVEGNQQAFLTIFDHCKPLEEYLFRRTITRDDILWISAWYSRTQESDYRRRAFWERDYLLHIPSIGKTWTYGYTPTLDAFTQDLADEPIPFDQFVGREKEEEAIERYLNQTMRNNVALIGGSGVGKHPLLIALAHQMKEGRVYPGIEGKRMLYLNLERLFGADVDALQRKATLTGILDESSAAGNIILVIDEFDRFIGVGQDRIDMSDVFYHHLTGGRLHVIALLSPGAYHQYFKPNTTLAGAFEIVEINPVNREEAMMILSTLLPTFEGGSVFVLYQGLRQLVDQTDRFMKDVPFPEKAITAMDGIVTQMKNSGHSGPIGPDEINAYIEGKTHIPISVSGDEGRILLTLENALKKQIVGQDEAVVAVARALRRVRADVSARKDKPIGSFLFLGPTGVGKTETAKVIAGTFFGSTTNLIRFDMSEFKEDAAIQQFLGDFASGKVGMLSRQLSDHPYGVILLDEFEKAHKDILNLFLTALDEGYVTDAFSKKVYLTNTIVVATSNAGAEYIRERISAGAVSGNLQKDVVEYVQKEGIFTPELINRFDAVVVYHPLTQEDIQNIFAISVAVLTDQVYAKHGIRLQVTEETKQRVIAEGFNRESGGRALSRAIQKYIEDPLAQKILKKDIVRGQDVEV